MRATKSDKNMNAQVEGPEQRSVGAVRADPPPPASVGYGEVADRDRHRREPLEAPW